MWSPLGRQVPIAQVSIIGPTVWNAFRSPSVRRRRLFKCRLNDWY